MNSPRHHPSTPNTEKANTIAPFAAVAAMLGLCCGLPLLASLGVLGAVAGIGLGSGLIVALSAAAVAVGLVRWRRTGNTCPAPPDDNPSRHMHDTVLSPTHPPTPIEMKRNHHE